MTMATFFISDTHFGHENILHLANRPFEDVREMKNEMIDRWNKTVGDRDLVYHLGDFAWKGEDPYDILTWLNGTIVILQGNHDPKPSPANCPEFRSSPYFETTLRGTKFVLCHYPIESWNGMYKGAIHLHGHTHGHEFDRSFSHDGKKTFRRFNVGVEAIDYTPVSLDAIMEYVRD